MGISPRRAGLGAAVLLAASAVSAANDDVFDSFRRFTSSDGKTTFVGLESESVEPFSGMLKFSQTDLVLPGRAGLDVRLTRSYRSKIWGRADYTVLQDALIGYKEPSVLGWGWTFHMGQLRNPYSVPTLGTCGGDFPVYTTSEGEDIVFYPLNPGNYYSKNWWKLDTNCKTGIVCVFTDNGIRIEFRKTDQFFYAYSGTVPVLPAGQIFDSHNNYITITYHATYKWAITQIIDAWGRQIDFSYNSPSTSDRLRLQYFTHNGKRFTFQYTSVPTSERPGGGNTEFLTGVTPPAGPGWKYEYATTVTIPENKYGLSKLTTPFGGTLSYQYGQRDFFAGRETVKLQALLKRVQGGRATAGTWTYDYVSTSTGTEDVTTITRPDALKEFHRYYGFGWAAPQNKTGILWQVGLPKSVSLPISATTNRVETFTWNAGPVVTFGAYYTAPSYGPSCPGLNPQLYDSSIIMPVLAGRSVAQDGATWGTTYSGFDSYGRPGTITETGQFTRVKTLTYLTLTQLPSYQFVGPRIATQRTQVGADYFDDSNEFNTQGDLLSQTRSTVKTTFSYNADGTRLRTTDPLGSYIEFRDYPGGKGLPRIVDYNGVYSVTRNFTPEGWIQDETNGRNKLTRWTYDDLGRPLTMTRPIGAGVTYSYAPDNSWSKATVGSPNFHTRSYDGFGRSTGEGDSEGVLTQLTYDALGRLNLKSYPYDGTTLIGGSPPGDTFQLDGIGRTTKITHSDGKAASVSFTGATVTRTDERGYITKLTYASAGEPDTRRLSKVFDAANYTWTYDYNAHDSLTAIHAPIGLADRTYGYDTRNFLKTESSLDHGTIIWNRNDLGQPTDRTDAEGLKETYTYDTLHRKKTVKYGSGSSDDTTFGWDNENNLTSVSNSNGGTFTLTYDDLNRLTDQVWSYLSMTFSSSWRFDSVGCNTTVIYPSGLSVSQSCDTANRVKAVTGYATSVSYHPTGKIKSVTLANGKVSTTTFDARQRPWTINVPGVIGLVYGYDEIGNVTLFDNTAVPNSSRTMTYDPLERLRFVDATGLWRHADHFYDAVGNRWYKEIDGRHTDYVYTNNRLSSATGAEPATYTYDLAGRLKSDGTATYTWDVAGRLSTAPNSSYAYDGRDFRFKRVEAGRTILFHHSPSGTLMSETTSTGKKLRDFIRVAGSVIAADGRR